MKRDRARAILLRDNKLLIIWHTRDGIGYFVLPGGGIEEGELPETTVIRELQEETSIDSKIIDKLVEIRDKDDVTHHLYLCEYISGIPKLSENSPEVLHTPAGHSYEPKWIDIVELKNNPMWPLEVKEFLLNYFKLQ